MQQNKDASQDGLDEYIHVVSAGGMVTIAALVALLVATIVWGIVGKIPVTVTVTGIVVPTQSLQDQIASLGGDGSVPEYCICCLDAKKYPIAAISDIHEEVKLEMPDDTVVSARIALHSFVPFDRQFMSTEFFGDNEWLVSECVPSNYNWVLMATSEDLSQYERSLAKATFVLDEVSPVSYLVGGR